MSWFDPLRGGVVVSAQAMDPASPLDDPRLLSLLAQAAELGGAAGFRVDGPAVVADLRPATGRPIVGIVKDAREGYDVYITPTVRGALDLVEAGADVVAAQATRGSRPGERFAEIVAACHAAGVPVVADVSTFDEARIARDDGADAVATTMVGFTAHTAGEPRPALGLVRRLKDRLDVPVVCEGGIWTPEHVAACFAAGADAVVVGSAVTAPDLITARLVAASPSGAPADGVRSGHAVA